ncbi:Nif3-like dinuclear metal center hexameric protein [Photobacterium iliopiscarium]|uniref:Nif3-like dinuclear metal center hexameric protein n=1 Tax=Photobacterium iliopiscarium TaxID=56192 RepID=UPI001E4EF4D2|nr:Nif3-like dinuclear metal center hexameric protein [Photobacterium iliopiscarium]MCD9467114.1 Nif3-like dinuclear metal center hexameric protein [Photobacterium iliopiscarium]MCD9487127.1 Nif3-like dinuclear metal center hexameric protein [Photobacterium iliopiscarium]MCF2243699.1 Nif3-like dinuclear metal center hexameric protein [Photobacterium iliopiscarium]
MNNLKLAALLNDFLSPHLIKDYCPNGLQIEGKPEITKVITGVTACQALIDRAIAEHADAILVHHGFFWKGESAEIRGMKYRRIKALIENGINLYAYHLPLDVHQQVGNNVQLAQRLGLDISGGLEINNPRSIAIYGELDTPLTGEEFAARIAMALQREPLHIGDNAPALIKKVGWCTGGGQDYIELAVEQGCDAFISGEVSERTTHIARELGIHYFAAGHHATERYGVKALGEWLAKEYDVDVEFIDINNPV